MIRNYPKAYKEILEILKYIPQEDVNKIPNDLLKMFELKMDKDYNIIIDTYKSFEKQNFLEETKAIFANIYRDYLSSPEYKAKILVKQAKELFLIEQEKQEKYNSNNIFKYNEEENIKNATNTLIKYKEDKLYKRLFVYIKKIFDFSNIQIKSNKNYKKY